MALIKEIFFMLMMSVTYIYVLHIIYAKDKSLRGEVFNAGTGTGYKVKDIVKKIC